MCGICGFFTGCDIASEQVNCRLCISAPLGAPSGASSGTSSRKYKTPFNQWERKSSLKTQPIRRAELNDGEQDKFLFPKKFIPVLRHPRLLNLPKNKESDIRSLHLLRYLRFTICLEMGVVNKIIHQIALTGYFKLLPPEMQKDAYYIYCDEAYHALQSHILIAQIVDHYPHLNIDYQASFLTRFTRDCEGLDHRQKTLAQLLFVIISETLITNTLKINEIDMDINVKAAIRDHFDDEILHHHYFRQALFFMWDQISVGDRDVIRRLIIKQILSFLSPDEDMICKELTLIGFTEKHAKTIFMETYTSDFINQHVVSATTKLRTYFTHLGLDEVEIFNAAEFNFESIYASSEARQ